MDGHAKRAIKKGDHIKKSALELFNKYGVKKVSIDEIASYANVSKVTIYKYFDSKDGLYRAIVKMIFDENVKALKDIFDSEAPFLEKLKFLMAIKSSSVHHMKGGFLQELIKSDCGVEEYIESSYMGKIKELIFDLIEYGKKEGYIDNSLPNETIYLYMEIFKAGLKEKLSGMESVINDQDTFEKLINLYFYGLIKKSDARHTNNVKKQKQKG